MLRQLTVLRRPFAGLGDPESRRTFWYVAIGILAAAAAGALVGFRPPFGFAAAVLAVAGIWIVALGARIERFFLGALALIVLGYVLMGRGFAYLGAPPVYVGEMVLALGAVASVSAVRINRLHPVHLLIGGFMLWGALRTVPFVGTYQIDALRDGVIWGYAFFAIAVSLTVRREHVDFLVRALDRLVPLLILWIPVAVLLSLGSREAVPGAVPLLSVKGGDAGVDLGAAAAFVIVGLSTTMSGARETLFWIPWLGTVGLVGSITRGGMLAALSSSAALLFVRTSIRWVRVVLVGIVLIGSIGLINPEVDLGIERKLSFEQLAVNALSVVIPQDDEIVDGTKEWRLRWWNAIFDYTLHGPYFWTGKGFGINLADDDGFQVAESGSLRAPHNGHIAILARAGVPGFVLWIALLGGYALTLVRAAWQARAARQFFWVQLIGVLFVYWLAAVINLSFDVYLEGPQGAIPFWSSIGLGLAVVRLAAEERRKAAAPSPVRQSDRAVPMPPPTGTLDGSARKPPRRGPKPPRKRAPGRSRTPRQPRGGEDAGG